MPPVDDMVKIIEGNEEIEEGFLKNVLAYIMLRTRLDYNYTEIFHYLFKCRCFGLKRGATSLIERRHVLYARGNEKLERELDVINLVKSIRQLRLMG